MISPDIPSKTIASLHTVGQGCRVPLQSKQWVEVLHLFRCSTHRQLWPHTSLSHTTLSHNYISHTHTTLTTQHLCHTHLCHTQLFVTHNSFTHNYISHTHTTLSHTKSFNGGEQWLVDGNTLWSSNIAMDIPPFIASFPGFLCKIWWCSIAMLDRL